MNIEFELKGNKSIFQHFSRGAEKTTEKSMEKWKQIMKRGFFHIENNFIGYGFLFVFQLQFNSSC